MQKQERSNYLNVILSLLSLKKRIDRSRFWMISLAAGVIFWAFFALFEQLFGVSTPATLLLYLPLYITALILSARRYHDIGKSAWWLLVFLIPLVGPIWVSLELCFRKGTDGDNQYGPDPSVQPDYMVVS